MDNLIHPEEEYRAFGQMIIQADPTLDEALEDEDIIQMYNDIREQAPEVNLDQLSQLIPTLVKEIQGKYKPAPTNREDRLSVLNSMMKE